MSKQSKTIISSAMFIFDMQKICFASELENPTNTAHTQTVTQVPFSSSAESICTQDHLPAVAEINTQLRKAYGQINPRIKLSLHSHAEISRLSAKYESFPTDISYNHKRNQATLTWKTGAWGFFRSKTRTEVFDLAAKSKPAVATPISTVTRNTATTEPTSHPPAVQRRTIATDQSSICSDDSTLSMICLPGNSSRYLQQNKQLKTYVFRPEISFPRNIYEGQMAFFFIYNRFPDIHTNFTLTTYEFNRIASDFVRYGYPTWMNVAIDDYHTHVLIFEWTNAQRFHYRLTWKWTASHFPS